MKNDLRLRACRHCKGGAGGTEMQGKATAPVPLGCVREVESPLGWCGRIPDCQMAACCHCPGESSGTGSLTDGDIWRRGASSALQMQFCLRPGRCCAKQIHSCINKHQGLRFLERKTGKALLQESSAPLPCLTGKWTSVVGLTCSNCHTHCSGTDCHNLRPQIGTRFATGSWFGAGTGLTM